ncbi:MAG: hypothetical protein PVG61_03245 [Dehalococcoidia bacterium]|jgi:hypothetical protein
MVSEIRKNRLNITRLLAYLVGTFILTIFIHESGHFFAALAIGVPVSEIEIGMIGHNLGVTIPDRFFNVPLGLFYYSGGFFAAFVVSCVYFLIWYRKYRYQPSFMTWAYGAVTITSIGMQLGQGYLEGQFHAAYMSYADSLFNTGSMVIYAFFALAMLFHFQFFPIIKLIGQNPRLKKLTEQTVLHHSSP